MAVPRAAVGQTVATEKVPGPTYLRSSPYLVLKSNSCWNTLRPPGNRRRNGWLAADNEGKDEGVEGGGFSLKMSF